MTTTTKPRQIPLLPFTDFETVTPKTNLERLDLNWRERDLPERTRTKHVHRLHPYLGKFIPQMAEIFLRKYQPKLVCDPFCGSGTTLVEALSLGINSFGSDISEFNCLLSKVKTVNYDVELLEKEITDILEKATGNEGHKRLIETRALYRTNEYLQSWFAPEALIELIRFRDVIQDYYYQDVLKVILSRAARSARLTTHFDLDFPQNPQTEPYWCYKHKRTCKPTTHAKQFLSRYSHDTLKRIKEFADIRQSSATQIECGDSRTIEFPAADLILTSPPYVGLIDYHAQHKYAFELLGLTPNEDAEIGSASMGSSKKAKSSYQDDIKAVFTNLEKYTRRNCTAVVIVHDRSNLYRTIADELGYRTLVELHRHVDRRTGRRASEFYESIFVWKTR